MNYFVLRFFFFFFFWGGGMGVGGVGRGVCWSKELLLG